MNHGGIPEDGNNVRRRRTLRSLSGMIISGMEGWHKWTLSIASRITIAEASICGTYMELKLRVEPLAGINIDI